jgi:signal transduction histidine kinase
LANVELRQKFVFLALIYALSLTANVALSTYCILVYIDRAFQDYSTVASQGERIGRLRSLLEEQRERLAAGGSIEDLARSYADTQRYTVSALEAARADLPVQSPAKDGIDFERALERKDVAVTGWLKSQRGKAGSVTAAPDEVNVAFATLLTILSDARSQVYQQGQAKFDEVNQTQGRVVSILVGNAVGGTLLIALGVYFVRRWVLRPVGDLREAAKQIALGKFDYRIKPRSHDELGHLAREVNQMAGTIVEMQTQLVEQERLAAAGEMVTRLAHNIRNPLAGIRGLAETTITLHAGDEEVVGSQQRIINTVDRFEKWLRDLQQSVSPLKLNLQNVKIGDLLEGVVTALSPMFDRRGVKVEVLIDPLVREVHLDSLHFEQAVVALITNAVQASQAGQLVQVLVGPASDAPGRWRFTVEDHGVGIPAELRKKIFLPYFTTKPEGNGIGLAMANKVVRLHGGDLAVESEVGRGSRFHATLPGLVAEA